MEGKFLVPLRGKAAVKNHIFAAICGFVELQSLSIYGVLKNCYQLQRNMFSDVIAGFVSVFLPSIKRLDPEFTPVVKCVTSKIIFCYFKGALNAIFLR